LLSADCGEIRFEPSLLAAYGGRMAPIAGARTARRSGVQTSDAPSGHTEIPKTVEQVLVSPWDVIARASYGRQQCSKGAGELEKSQSEGQKKGMAWRCANDSP
jgi:hypothetical protein